MTNAEKSLPNAKVGQITELLKKLELLGGNSDKEGLSYALNVKVNTLYNPMKASELLGFISINKNDVKLTKIGQKFLTISSEDQKRIFKEQTLKIEPFITISKALEKQDVIEPEFVLRLVKAKIKAARKWKPSTEREMLRMIVNWGTYSEIFKHDSKSGKILSYG